MSAGAAVVWQLGSKGLNAAAQLVIVAVLARLLTPDEFGSVAIVTVFTLFFAMLADVGVSPAIVQFEDLGEEECSALLTFSAVLGMALSLLFCVAAYPLAAFYGDDLLVPLCQLASLSVLFSAANMVPNGLLLRARRFKTIALRLVATTLIAGTAAIALALAGLGCYALVLQSVIQAATVFVWNMVSSRLKPGNVYFMSPVRRIFRYSAFQAGFSFVNYFARNLDNLLVGRFFGSAALGFYDKAYRLNMYPIGYFSGVVASVLQPYLVKLKDSPSLIYECYRAIAKGLSLSGAYTSVVFMVCAEEVVMLFYGDQWSASVVLFRALAASVAFQMFNSIAGAIFQTLERTDYMLYTSLVNTAITVAAIMVGVASGDLLVLAMLVTVAYTLHTVTNSVFMVRRAMGQDLLGFASIYLPELVLVAAGCAFAWVFPGMFGSDALFSLALKLAACTGACGVLYAVTGQFGYLHNLIQLARKK